MISLQVLFPVLIAEFFKPVKPVKNWQMCLPKFDSSFSWDMAGVCPTTGVCCYFSGLLCTVV